ncbi:MAG: tRNA (pseudouridine(54)-N(1))-methyltransferase TrmY [Candidatus Methanomethylicota archaeon]|uniref:tRNA (pseudouridine(54)-N(1))-methyltransferase n=1 Tax=Thermoproteota archaeon TaxID=2056631 RepID=A0A497EWW6_9CREN|nr:MAG: tRNA (pseudouridine(54)-N(1))-methyltransferase TrmY [Candidatus Verstraetearchaeota archaeon]
MKLIKRLFIIRSSTARTAADFPLKDLAGAGGRFDVVCRALIAALAHRDGVRKDVEFYAVLKGPPAPPKTIHVNGENLRHIPLSEVEVAELIFRTFKGLEVEGVQVLDIGFEKLVRKLVAEKVKLYYLHQDGIPIETLELHQGVIGFILGDHVGLSSEEERFLESLNIKKVCLGPKVYLSSHCIIIANYELDKKISMP